MGFTTLSSALYFYQNLEDFTTRFYEKFAANENYSALRELFLDLARDNIKQKNTVLRTYQEAITDILEVGSSLDGMREEDYLIPEMPVEDSDMKEVLNYAITLEDCGLRFCLDISKKIRTLLTDISRPFESAGKKKGDRKNRLEAALRSLG
ncbi:hypothetical protein KEJ21_02610 [Candidatus Bathyarchaeota archaeon]|nr:hypothetical protein [Candidatus Bathyarchaeota archaeon]MBS7631347.1 hypothetical protein [Candidatus Bathyarchaeota archaeon]